MGTPSVIDLNALKAPISEAAPTGENLSEHSLMYDLRSLADTARSAEKKWAQVPIGSDGKPQVPEGTQAPPIPNWGPVQKNATEILRTKSKDLAVCAMLLESLTRIHGFAGIRDGAELICELAESYWGELFPPFDQDEFEAIEEHPTIAAISGLNGLTVLPFAIDRIPLVKSSPLGPLTGIDYLDAFGTRARVAEDLFMTSARAVSENVFDTLYEDAEAALSSYRKMAQLLGEKCQESHAAPGPSSSTIEDKLEDSLRRIRHISGRSASAPTVARDNDDPAPNVTPPAASGGRSSSPVPGGPLQTRGEAYEMLQKVADFFSKTEPHSPVSTALKRIVAWRNLSFPELMKELVDNSDARRDLFRLTGFKDEDS